MVGLLKVTDAYSLDGEEQPRVEPVDPILLRRFLQESLRGEMDPALARQLGLTLRELNSDPADLYAGLSPTGKAYIDAWDVSTRFPERPFEEVLKEQLAVRRKQVRGSVRASLSVVEGAVASDEVESAPVEEPAIATTPAARIVRPRKRELKAVAPEFTQIGDVAPEVFGNMLERFVCSQWIGGPVGVVGKCVKFSMMVFIPGRDGRWKADTRTMVSALRRRIESLDVSPGTDATRKHHMIEFLAQFA